jgi:DeoR/GlpR family transcriptional regulator of sugar metabolism
MIKTEREQAIITFLSGRGEVAIDKIASHLGSVSTITIRRDVARLAAQGLVERTHGGALSAKASEMPSAAKTGVGSDDDIAQVDAIVLPPIHGRSADTLRLGARRRGIPFLAESAPQEGGVYLGPDNFEAGRVLGELAGRGFKDRIESARVLLVTLQGLPNTRARCEGFLAGFTEAYGGPVQQWRVDGQGSYRISLRGSLDAFETHPNINVVFGVNDHSILAALEAAERLRVLDVAGYSVGGEGGALFDALEQDDRLKACVALFPEIVGMRAIDVLADALGGGAMPPEVRTPHAVLDRTALARYYRREDAGWSLLPGVADTFGRHDPPRAGRRPGRGKSIGFVPHYPAHDWYRNMARAMRSRALERQIDLRMAAPQAGIAREIHALRLLIAKTAAERVAPGDTILINAGVVAMIFAEAIETMRDVTIVTNSLDVLEHLHGRLGLKVILTSGEYQPQSRCLVGPSLGALFETLRVDKAFLSVDGMSARFGLSSADERRALAARRFINASRQVFVLADHSLVGLDATHRIAAADSADELITDSGSLPADRLAFLSVGVRATLADADTAPEDPPDRWKARWRDQPQAAAMRS